MPNPKIVNITVGKFKALLNEFERRGDINDNTELWLSSDEEGNSYSPLIQVNDTVNLSAEKNKITLYPSSEHSEME